jgi:TonB family protein
MKKTLILSFILLGCTVAYAGNPIFDYHGRTTPAIKKDKFSTVKYLSEIMPGFIQNVTVPYKDRIELNDRMKIVEAQNYVYPSGISHKEKYEEVIDYISVEMKIISNGKSIQMNGEGDVLSQEQKEFLMTADYGSDLKIKVRFIYKDWACQDMVQKKKVMEGEYTATVIPEKEAEFPCGIIGMNGYIQQEITDILINKNIRVDRVNAIVSFCITEQGKVTNVQMERSSENAVVDEQILDAVKHMPDWKPATDKNGNKVTQDFKIPFGVGEGC